MPITIATAKAATPSWNDMGKFSRKISLTVRLVDLKDGPKFTLDGFSAVDEALLAQLDDKDAGNLARNGYLGWIYMHLLSLHNVADLTARLEPRLKK